MKLIAAIASLLFVSQSALADVIFFDFNDSPQEIAAARAGARARGERFILVPATTGQQLDDASITKALTDFNAAHPRASVSVVISGHDGNGHFSGERGGSSAAELGKLFKDAGVDSRVDSLFLAGCYTTTLGAVEFDWRGKFANATLVGGYEGIAPGNDKLAGHQYMQAFIANSRRLMNMTSRAQIGQAVRGLRGFNMTNAACMKGDVFVSNQEVKSSREMLNGCSARDADPSWNERVQCFTEAREPACHDVPSDTANGELRQIYRRLQATAHCDQIFNEQNIYRPNREKVIRLIFDRQVRANMQNNLREEIAAANAGLEAIGSQTRLANFATGSRHDVLENLKNASREIEAKCNAQARQNTPTGVCPFKKDPRYVTALLALQNINEIYRSSASCVPFGWVEPNNTDRSRCVKTPEETRYAVQVQVANATRTEQRVLELARTPQGQQVIAQMRVHPAGSYQRARVLESTAVGLNGTEEDWEVQTAFTSANLDQLQALAGGLPAAQPAAPVNNQRNQRGRNPRDTPTPPPPGLPVETPEAIGN
jgi:hypothetical protein